MIALSESTDAKLTDDDRDNVAADVYARAMVDLAREHPGAEGIVGCTDTLIGGVASLTICLRVATATHAGVSYTGKAGPEVKRPRSHILAQVVAALAHDVGGCDCRGLAARAYQAAVADKAPMVCPAATEVLARCKSEVDTRLAAALVIKSISVFATP